MTSTSLPYGFDARRHPSGTMVRTFASTITSGYAANIFKGDPVRLLGSGNTGTLVLATSDGTRAGTVDGVKILGIFAGVDYTDSTGKPTKSNFWPTGTVATNIVAYVNRDPLTEYAVQYTNPSPGTSIQAAIGQQCDWVPTAPGGNTSTGLSATYLTAIQGTAGQFQILGLADSINDNDTDAYVNVIVRINESQLQASVNSPT